MFAKFETKEGSSTVGTDTGQDTTTAQYPNKAAIIEAIKAGELNAGDVTTTIQNGQVVPVDIKEKDVNTYRKVDNEKDPDPVTTTGIMTQEEFDALPPDVGNPPGTMLTPSGKTRDDRNEWFAKYGNTHNTNGKKKTYSQYVADMTPSTRRRR